MPNSQQVCRRVVDLQPGQQYTYRSSAVLFNPEEPNSCCSSSYYWPAASCGDGGRHGDVNGSHGAMSGSSAAVSDGLVRTEAMLELLVQILAEPAFDQLRTKEQLGYIVWTRSHYSPNFQVHVLC